MGYDTVITSQDVMDVAMPLVKYAKDVAKNETISYVKRQVDKRRSSKKRKRSKSQSSPSYGKAGFVTPGIYTGKMVPAKVKTKKTKGKTVLVSHKEIKGTISDPDVAFIGIGFNYQYIIEKFFQIFVKSLFDNAGINVDNYDQSIIGTYSIQIEYYQTPVATAITARQTIFGANSSLNVIAAALRSDWQTAWVGNVHKLKQIKLQNTVDPNLCQIVPSATTISVKVMQALLLQNQTPGSAVSDVTADNITANPVYCQVYDSNSNIVYQKTRNNTTDASWKPWLHYNDTYPELFAYAAADQYINIPNQVADFFTNAKIKYKSLLQPGEMRKVQQIYTFTGNMNEWLKIYYDFFDDVGGNQPSQLPGGQRIIAFDKMLDSDASSVSIGYELNQKCIGRYKTKKFSGTVPLYD